jgi:formimidoylglutamate deiminase
MTALLWAPRAWICGHWQDAVLLRAGADGHWAEVRCGTPAPPQATVLPGPVLPGLVDAHSHAFQRAFAGLAERRTGEHDDFWSWRDRMYGVALRITPAQLRAVAAQLYAELLCGGYTQVCEFHYLHHDEDGAPYPDPLAMSRALADAAAGTGIGLTLLPVLYQRAGFLQPLLRPDQRRFATDARGVLALRDGVRAWRLPRVDAGVAIHSLRAAAPASIHELVRGLDGDAGPIHIHIAEQTAEVDDCLAATGARPIEWLAREWPLDARWQLVHATHALPAEIDAVAASGAGIVLCPSTEANLGDGLADLPRWLATGVPLTLGSDSNVTRCWTEELRWLDYGQRLLLRQRNVAALPSAHEGATAARLFERMLTGGGAAAGPPLWGLQRGARADLLVLDTQAPGLLGVPTSHTLDALVFATDAPALSEVWVAGRRVVAGGVPVDAPEIAAAFADAMAALWPD